MKFLFIIFTVFLFVMPIQAKYGGGTGAPEDPYQIATAEDLMLLGNSPEDYYKHFILTADIDLDPNLPGRKVFDRSVIAPDTNDVKSGFQGTPFSGVFDGSGRTISHLTIAGKSYLGLFGRLEQGAVVKNVGIVDAKVTSEHSHAGILAGYNLQSHVRNCHSSGIITSGADWIGGLVGYSSGSVTGCFSSSNVRGRSYLVGGLAGANTGLVACCYSTGAVSGDKEIGGLVGRNSGRIADCYSTGYVSGQSDVGGLVGKQEFPGSVAHSFWDIQTSRLSISDGGMGKTTDEMKDPNIFMTAGWDFVNKPDGPSNIWAEPVEGGYPILWWQLSPLPELPTFSGGTGKPAAPYFITTADELTSIGHNGRLMEVNFKLMADIDLRDLPFYPIGNEVYPYAGVFDGNGHTISNLTYDSNGVDCIGLFGYVSNPSAEIKDMGLIDHHIDAGTGDYVGSLVGYLADGIINRCSVEGGSVSAERYVGGLVGFSYGGYITTSDSTGTVTGKPEVGGLVGGNWGNIATSYSSGTVTGDGSHGWVGGLVGENYGLIATSYSSGTVTGDGWVGGLVGGNCGGIATSYSSGTVTGDGSVGGLVGENTGSGSIATSYSSSNVTGDGWVGGLAGVNVNTITNCYATGSVLASGTEWLPGVGGGLVGENLFWGGKISNCYATGSVLVSGTELSPGVSGGLVGKNSGEVIDSLWDTQTSGQAKSAGGTGKTTSEMHMESTFTDSGWDFFDESENGTEGTWSICEGVDYPRLTWQFVVGDFDGDDYVDFADFCIFAVHWLGTDSSFFCGDGGTDLTNDGKIDIHDMREFAKYWLKPQPSEPPQPPAPSPPEPPPKGRSCFLPDTPVWVNGGLVQISNVVVRQMVGLSDNSVLPNVCSGSIEEIEEHEGMFECRDIVLESEDCINVVDAHCFMLDSGRWVAAQDLKSGLKLKTLNGEVTIRSVATRAVPFVGKVYNLKVKGTNQYFVGKDRVIVRDY